MKILRAAGCLAVQSLPERPRQYSRIMDSDLDRARELLKAADVMEDDLLLVTEAGSTMHGVGVGAQDDLDLVAVRIEPFAELISGQPRRQSMMVRTQPDGARSGPGDIDINCYTLRRYADLVAAGNPTLLNTLFLPKYFLLREEFPLAELRSHVDLRRAGAAYQGYMSQQLSNWRGPKPTGRKDLIERFGFDTKYAYHAIRLGLQGVEFLTTGAITLPIPEPHRERLLALRTGEISEPDAMEWADRVQADLDDAASGVEAPAAESPRAVVVDVYRRWYGVS